MRSAGYIVLAAAALAAPAAHADVTIRYHNDSKFMPAAMADQTIRIKGNRASFNIGKLEALVDFTRQELSIVDPAGRMFATIPLSQYGAKVKSSMPQMPAVMTQMFDPAHTKVASASTGRTETIQGMAAEEKEVTVTVQIPLPTRDSSSGAEMKMALRIWTAKSDEFLRTPALRELTAFSLWQKYFMESEDLFPGQKAAIEQMMPAGAVILRMHMEMRMRMPGVADADAAAAPMMEMTQEVSEISTAPVEDSLFRIPEDFHAAPFEDLFRGAVQAGAAAPVVSSPRSVKAYVPSLAPLQQTQPSRPDLVHGMVELLVTIDAQGHVTNAEVLAGPHALRQPALDAVKQWKYRPVIRDGASVSAYTDATVTFLSRDSAMAMPDLAEMEAATRRRMGLEKEFPRTPQQILADLEQDAGGGGDGRRYDALDKMAKAAVEAGALDKAAAYARELLSRGSRGETDWNYGNAVHDGNMVLGLVALRQGDARKAGTLLLEAGKTPGSPQLDSFGPDMTLAKELLDKGESSVVLEYFSLCGNFWKTGAQRLEEWSQTVRGSGIPEFGPNLRSHGR